MQLLITISFEDSPEIEIATFYQLVDLELERCFVCQRVFKKTKHLPFHCTNCFVLRNDRWLRDLARRTKSFPTSMIGVPHAD